MLPGLNRKIRIRRMTADDIGQVLEVERACFSEPWSADAFSATLLLPYAHYYVAEIEGDGGEPRIIGECGVRDIVGEGEITNVAVLPQCRGYGIASQMLGILLEESVQKVRNGENPELTTRMKHTRECYVVAEEGADLAAIEQAIKTMPNYFDEYDTTVTFISPEEMKENHNSLPHGGSVIRSGKTGLHNENTHTIEYSLKLDSNPEFTSSVLVCCARALNRKVQKGVTGCMTMLDLAPAELSSLSAEELRAHSL